MISLRELGARSLSSPDSIDVGKSKVFVHQISNFLDDRGGLAIIDFETFGPFLPKRIFYSFNVPKDQSRGHHAHKACHQFLVAIGGACTVKLSDGKNSIEIRLDSQIHGISVPPMVWMSQSDFSEDAVLLVLASEPYDEDDYIRDHEEFLKSANNLS